MHGRKRVFASIVGLTVLVTTLVVSTGQPALAAGCSQTGCDNQDAGTMGCVDDKTKNAYTVVYNYYASANYWANMTIYLRWSPTCGTNWAKAVITSSNPPNWGFQMEVELQDSGYHFVGGTHAGLANTRSIYGNMHYAPTTPMRACAAIDDPNFPGGYHCTPAG